MITWNSCTETQLYELLQKHSISYSKRDFVDRMRSDSLGRLLTDWVIELADEKGLRVKVYWQAIPREERVEFSRAEYAYI